MRNVGLAGGKYEAQICDLLPANDGRSSLVLQMLEAYELTEKCIPITVHDASKDDMMKFHDEEFVRLLLVKRPGIDSTVREIRRDSFVEQESIGAEAINQDEYTKPSNALLEKFGLLYDCPLFPYMSQYVRTVAGSSISAAKFLTQSSNKVALNWNGGRHHCKKSKASGFCYVNDIVLSILELRKKFDKVMYIDLDLHHGDGVETAFKFSDKVTTFSVHRKDVAFFPGTGELNDVGKGKGTNYCFNIPTRHGLDDKSMKRIIHEILMPTIQYIKPNCLVIQCGCDGLSSDEHQEWNLTIRELGNRIGELLDLEIPTLLLGGGGYNHHQVARFWTYVTSIALRDNIEFDILPDCLTSFDNNGEYEFWNVKPKNMINENDENYMEFLKCSVLNRLN